MNKLAAFMRDYSVAGFLVPFGIFGMIFGVAMLIIVSNSQDYKKVDAVVSKAELYQEAHNNGDEYVEATYDVYVKYTVDGKEYETGLGIVSGYKLGEKTTIYYDPKDPTKITSTKSYIFPIIIIAAGVAAFIGGLVSIIRTKNKREAMRLQEEEWKHGN